MNVKIENFLKKWDEMLEAANEISEFEWEFKVKITSDNDLSNERVKTINGINHSFTKHNMSWSSSN